MDTPYSTLRKYLTGSAVAIGVLAATPVFADDALDQAMKNDNNWATYGRTFANTRFSPLNQITDQNVGQLKLAYAFQLGALRSNEATPIEIDGTLYVPSSSGPRSVYALDARTGKIRWQYQPVIAEDVEPFVCCDLDSRGVTYADGKILFGTLDGRLIALDAKTGKEVWKTEVVDYKQGSAITSPPTIAKNLVISGFAGGEYGVRGAIQAFDLATGKLVWKTYTIPGTRRGGQRHLEGRQLAAWRRRCVAGRLLRPEDQHGVLWHQQSRAVERSGAQHRNLGLRQADQRGFVGDPGARRRHRENQVGAPVNAGRSLGL